MRARNAAIRISASAVARLALTLGFAGCGPVVSFTPRGDACTARAEECALAVIHRRPEKEYAVIGVLDVEAFSVRRIPRDDAAFLDLVRAEACRAGADAVIPGITGDGRYVQATVVKWIERGEPEPVCPPEPPEREGPVIAGGEGAGPC